MRACAQPGEQTGSIEMDFDYTAAAELFIAKRSGGSRAPLGYRRFASAAEAIRFAVEELPGGRILGAFMQVGDLRFDADAIRSLYAHQDYPLQRAEASQEAAGLTPKPVRR
jgi:hypothetical protein